MSDTGETPLDQLGETEQRNLIPLFIKQSKKQKAKLLEALLRCSAAEDQMPATTLRSAINSISETIAALQAGTKTLADLKRFHVHVSFNSSEVESPALITVELSQKPRSNPLPLSHFIQIDPPLGESVKTPRQKKVGESLRYIKVFDFGERTPETIHTLLTKDFTFSICSSQNYLGKRVVKPYAFAVAPLSPLRTSLSTSMPLHFVNFDGKKSNFVFDVKLSVAVPLAPVEDFTIDEFIDVIPT